MDATRHPARERGGNKMERERKGDKGKIWGGGKEKANIQDAVTVRGRCVRPRYNGHGAQELATRDPSCAR